MCERPTIGRRDRLSLRSGRVAAEMASRSDLNAERPRGNRHARKVIWFTLPPCDIVMMLTGSEGTPTGRVILQLFVLIIGFIQF